LLLEADQPFISGELLDALLLLHDGKRIVASLSGGRHTLPAIVPRSLFAELSPHGTWEAVERFLAGRDDAAAVPFPEGVQHLGRGETTADPGRISTIIFDFGMVISSFEVAQFLRNLVPYTGKSMTELKDLLGIVRDIVIEYETGLMTTDDFVSRVFQATNLPLTREQFRQAYNDIFTPITSTHDLIRRLKPHYRLGLLSNTSEWHFQHAIRTAPVYPLFDAVTLSYEVKSLKPSRTIYDDMLAKLRSRPHECVYIDDIAENTEAAAWLGMHAIQYRGHDELVAELRRIGIIF
jgi:putative hydrolase of the HAD superfamily